MKTFELELRTPEGVVLNDEVEYVVLPGHEGGYGVLACHAPTVLGLDSGYLEYNQNGVKNRMFVMEGVADITGEKVTVLSDFIEKEENVESALKYREERLAGEKQRRKDSYFEYKQSSVALMKALKNLSGKRPSINN